jgi:hypothetical protein
MRQYEYPSSHLDCRRAVMRYLPFWATTAVLMPSMFWPSRTSGRVSRTLYLTWKRQPFRCRYLEYRGVLPIPAQHGPGGLQGDRRISARS